MENDNGGCSSSTGDGSSLGFEVNTTPGRHDRFIVPDYDCKSNFNDHDIYSEKDDFIINSVSNGGESDYETLQNPLPVSIPGSSSNSQRKYKLVGDIVKVDDQSLAKRRRPNNSCWNCGDYGHSNRDCTKPVNRSMLASNRQQFNKSRPIRNGVQRYYVDNEQRFDHLKPGVISRNLRKAMGLNKRQLPRHIYNMRRLGYPGGWLEEAKVLHSGITLFDSKGHVVADPDDEEGEVVDDLDQRSKYDINKLIKYPGFNVPPPPDVIDEAENFGLPPMRPDQNFENLIESLKSNEAKPYRRQKIPIIPSASPPRVKEKSDDNSAADMEYEETPDVGLLPEDGCGFVPPLPEEPLLPPPPPEDVPEIPSELVSTEDGDGSSSQSVDESVNRISPTLIELEEQKKSILVELNNTDSSDSLKDKEITSPAISRIQQSDTFSRTPSPNLGRMKSVDLGTPVLKSVSPYSKLPSPESFSQNICDVINFENLPDSTGIYDKMVGILGKVRSAVKRIHQNAGFN